MKRNPLRLTALTLTALLLLSLLTGCGSKADMAYAEDAEYAAEDYAETTAAGGYTGYDHADPTEDGSLFTPADNRKEIRYADLSFRTEHYDDALAAIRQKVSDCGGYIESRQTNITGSDTSARYCSMTLRIPADRLDAFLSAAETDFGALTYSNVWSDDVTDSYTDTETRLEALRTQKDRLLALMEQANEMEDLITLEDALTDVIYEIESYEGSLHRLDDRIQYSTVTVDLAEVSREGSSLGTASTLGQRIAHRFALSVNRLADFAENALVFLLGNIAELVLWGAILCGLFLLLRRGLQKRHARKAAKSAAYSEKTEE